MLTYKEAKELNRKWNVIPIFSRIPADLDTPVGAYMKLVGRKRESFLLESIEGGEKLARYSFLGFDPFLVVEGAADAVYLKQGRRVRKIEANPVDYLREMFAVYKPVRIEGLPRFTGGGVGYFSYDAVRWIENIPDSRPDRIGLPLMRFGIYRHLVVFDHLKQEILVIANILHEQRARGLRTKYDRARRDIDHIVHKLQTRKLKQQPEPAVRSTVKPEYTRSEYEKMVRRAKHYIREGDIFQVVLSQHWRIKSKISALRVYRRLRRINPSPYMFLLNFGNSSVVGSSPEMMVRVEKGAIETRPIAGTRPRGKNAAEDDKLIHDLMSDTKELAEHTMLLDLGRNDVGRVSVPGTVHVAEEMIIEKYSHVIHIVSSVMGRLQRGLSPMDGLFSCFPAGTVSGAPKIRAMEIIDELEKQQRGVYAGAVAYLDFWGNLDSCIAIRTVVKKDDCFFVQAGAGIVADSRPRREFQETEAKAAVLITAITGKGID